MTVTIYHNPRCSKSRQTLEILRQRGIGPQVIEYLKTPPSAQRLGEILDLLGLEPRAVMRRQEVPYKNLGLDDPGLDRAALLTVLTENPVLIERPIVVNGEKAVLGRPPEAVMDIL